MESFLANAVAAVTIAVGIQQLVRPLIVWIRRHKHKSKLAKPIEETSNAQMTKPILQPQIEQTKGNAQQ